MSAREALAFLGGLGLGEAIVYVLFISGVVRP